MSWLDSPGYWISRLLIERGVAAIYLIAFLVAARQFVPLLGTNGLTPVPRFLRLISFRQAPSLFHWRYSDRLVRILSWSGVVVSAAILLGGLDVAPLWAALPAWAFLWVIYLSIVNVGQTWYAFGWESLLLETGFLAVFLGSGRYAAPTIVLWAMRWLLFRVEFGAGLIKIRGDRCWRDLTCLYYHHETQPMPNPLSWYFHHLPKPLHRVEVAGNHIAQLVVPVLLFFPQPVASAAGAVILITQGWLLLSGNFSWLNACTMVLALSAIDDAVWRAVFPIHVSTAAVLPASWIYLTVALGVLFAVLSYAPARNLLSSRQLMNFSFNPLHLGNTYGAFGSITRERREIVIEGTADPFAQPPIWLEYEFKGKPGDPGRRPPQVAPYHRRLDWLMWFAAMAPPQAHPWFYALVAKLLEGDYATLQLLRRNPFPGAPPQVIRARYFLYRFSTRAEKRATGQWWIRTELGEYLAPSRVQTAAATRPR